MKQRCHSHAGPDSGGSNALWPGTAVRMRLAVAVTPVWVWGLAISLLPHKEERFLYPVYPLVGDFFPLQVTVIILFTCTGFSKSSGMH